MATKKPDAYPVDEDHPNVDPTANVLQLVEAANLRQDDLRKAESRRLEDLRIAENRRLDEVAELRASHAKDIRAFDVAAIATASERASQQARVLENQVSTSAETLRTLVASTAAAQAQSQASISSQINERLALLERAQYKGEGRSGLSDPVMTELIAEVKGLRAVGERTSGKSAGISLVGAVTVGVVALLVSLLALAGGLPALLGRTPLL